MRARTIVVLLVPALITTMLVTGQASAWPAPDASAAQRPHQLPVLETPPTARAEALPAAIAANGNPTIDRHESHGPADPSIADLRELSDIAPERKLSSGVRAAISADAKSPVWLLVLSATAVDLTDLDDDAYSFQWPDGEHVSVLRVPAGAAYSVAARPGVYAVKHAAGEGGAVDPSLRRPRFQGPRPPDPVVRADALRAAPAWSEPAARISGHTADGLVGNGGDAAPSGWYDVRKGHAAEEAWGLGYRGDGVRVAVLDNAVDFAHPDLQNTWSVLPDGHAYAGWPQVFDPNVGLAAIKDMRMPPFLRSSRTAQNGRIELYQTSAVTPTMAAGETRYTACLQPAVFGAGAGRFSLAAIDCGHVVPGTSKSGEVRYGHHPDTSLRAYADLGEGVEGAWAGVLLVDEHVPGNYDTVYVDLDGDRDFSDEKPMTKASPLGWRDATGDGLADVSAGLLYWIADGALPFPVGWAWGLQDTVATAGSEIGIMWADGSHGTLCASGVVSQGVLKVPPERRLRFRDLEGGEPPSTNQGLAPGAELVSVGSVYTADAMFAAAWRYTLYGHDPASPADDIQVVSNSYGYSDVDEDGWDADSRLLDHLVRTTNPTLSYLFATGNGAPGYGTVTAPKPHVGLGVAASTQMGSTGSDMTAHAMDSITDTSQITFGDLIPWSNRGPGADGDIGVHVAADGADASGAVPLNTASDGAHANGTWNGTSRATPVLAGAMALVYQAYYESHGEWPTWDVARSIVMAGARYNGYDTLTTGAGVLDAADAVRIASGRRGVFVSPAGWVPGDYRGVDHPGFAHLVNPGESVTTTLTLHNPTERPVDVGLSAQELRRVGSYTTSLTTDPAQQSPASDVPDYLVKLDKERVPAATELMVARLVFPLDEFDRDGDYVSDNRFDVAVLQHTDINGDGELWIDENGNGVVNHEQMPGAFVDLAWDGGNEEAPAVEGFWLTRSLDADGVVGQAAWFGAGCGGETPAPDVSGKIAVIERGACRFQAKVANAQRAGALGAIIYTDTRPKATMFALPSGLTTPALMIDQVPGEALRDRLLAGIPVTATMGVRHTVGLDGAAPVVWENTEIQRYEYMRFSIDQSDHNNVSVSVHHPLERWADGMYLGLWHVDPATSIGAAVMGSADPGGDDGHTARQRAKDAFGADAAADTKDAFGADAAAATARDRAAVASRPADVGSTQAVTPTTLHMRFDFYAYEPWDAVTLSEQHVTVPAEDTVAVEAAFRVADDAPPGVMQGAIFADYDREDRAPIYLPALTNRSALGETTSSVRGPGTFWTWGRVPAQGAPPSGVSDEESGMHAGDDSAVAGAEAEIEGAGDVSPAAAADAEADLLPGGFELPFLRTVVPVVANVVADYDWQGTITLGGAAAEDPDATYDNGSVWGAFTWDWREESGDWRFFFVDAAPPPENTRWLYRTVWGDPADGAADIDTRVLGPVSDRFSDPDHPDNERTDMSDLSWFGPYTLGLLERSPYLVQDGSVWPFDTSSGDAEDWVSAPATAGGLHEVMLHNVLFSGYQFSMPFQTDVGAVRLSSESLALVGDVCATLSLTPTISLDDLSVRAFGVAEPEQQAGVPVVQDDRRDVASSSFRHTVDATTEAGRFDVLLEGEDDDDLDLFVLFDGDGDGTFSYPEEVVGESTTETAQEAVSLPGFSPAGSYEVWVHGFQVSGEDSRFDLTIDVVSGDSLRVNSAPASVTAGSSGGIEVCADLSSLQDLDGPASGILVFGPGGAPTLVSLPVTWIREP